MGLGLGCELKSLRPEVGDYVLVSCSEIRESESRHVSGALNCFVFGYNTIEVLLNQGKNLVLSSVPSTKAPFLRR